MCLNHGFHLDWSFKRYSEAAHHHENGLKEAIYKAFPALLEKEPHWPSLYEEKRQAFLQLLSQGHVQLMPGAAELLAALEKSGIKRCVVTNSPLNLIQIVRQQNPLLDTLPHWITREDYAFPKPNPECYDSAISRFAEEGDRIIGFEDSPKGLNALRRTRAQAVLVCPPDSPYLSDPALASYAYYPSFTAINEDNAPSSIPHAH